MDFLKFFFVKPMFVVEEEEGGIPDFDEDTEGQQDDGSQSDPGTDANGEPIEIGEGSRLKMGERELTYAEVQEALKDRENKANWQKEYTQRDMSLAEQRKALSKSAQLEDYLTKHPEAYGEIEAILKKSVQPQSGNVPNPEFTQLSEKLGKIEETLAVKEELGKIETEFKDLKGKYAQYFSDEPDLEKKIVSFALENDIRNMGLAFQAMMFGKVNAKTKEEGLREGAKNANRGRSMASPSGSGKVAPQSNSPKTWDDTEKAMMKALESFS